MHQAGGAQLVAEHIKCLSLNTEPANEKLLTVFCGMLMNYSNDNGNDLLPGPPPPPKRQRFVLHHSPGGSSVSVGAIRGVG